MASVPRLGRIYPLPAVLSLLVFGAVLAGLFVTDGIASMELLAYVIGGLGLLGNTFGRLRDDPGIRVLNIVLIAIALTLLYLVPPRTLIEGAIAVLAFVGVLVEMYNYYADASLLRAGS